MVMDMVTGVDLIRGELDPSFATSHKAMLMCPLCRQVQTHSHIGRREMCRPDTGRISYFELVYSCAKCACERVWGTT